MLDAEGFPKAHEVFAGNRPDTTTVDEMLGVIEQRMANKAQATVVVDRGMASAGSWCEHPGSGRDKMRIPLAPDYYRTMSEVAATTIYRTWMCVVCGFIYDEAKGLPEEGLAPGTRWEDVPDTWTCPDCGVTKDDFEMMEV